MIKLLGLVVVLLVATGVVFAQEDVPPIRNFLRINEEFCSGAQPRLEHLSRLKAEGITTIINLRPPTEHRAAEEEAMAKELGLRYFNIPVVFSAPTDEQVAEFLKITDDKKNRPAFIH
ncbi:MAG: fused DSP-PTPase phosphatase/NAD kinase-like protein, partial [Pyrinomonadaceae bacterium]